MIVYTFNITVFPLITPKLDQSRKLLDQRCENVYSMVNTPSKHLGMYKVWSATLTNQPLLLAHKLTQWTPNPRWWRARPFKEHEHPHLYTNKGCSPYVEGRTMQTCIPPARGHRTEQDVLETIFHSSTLDTSPPPEEHDPCRRRADYLMRKREIEEKEECAR